MVVGDARDLGAGDARDRPVEVVERLLGDDRRDLGPVRLVVVDSRNGRVLTPGERQMVDDDEWAFEAWRRVDRALKQLGR